MSGVAGPAAVGGGVGSSEGASRDAEMTDDGWGLAILMPQKYWRMMTAAGLAMMAITFMSSMRVKPNVGKWSFIECFTLCAPAAQTGIEAAR